MERHGGDMRHYSTLRRKVESSKIHKYFIDAPRDGSGNKVKDKYV